MNQFSKANTLFRSFWQAGFECADHLNYHGDRVDLLKETGHELLIDEDYAALKPFQIQTVREGIRWNRVEKKPGLYDWTDVIERIEAGQRNGIQQLWDICHFGFPDDLSPLQPHFSERLAAVSQSFVQLWHSLSDEPLVITPINEISFLSWLGGEVRGTVPYTSARGFELKYELVKAAIASIEAIWQVDARVRILHTEPLVHILPVGQEPEMIVQAAQANEIQFQTLDMLSGRICPELGGRIEYLDLIGLNYYFDNQWEHERTRIQWEEPRDPRWKPLSVLLQEVYNRYNRPMAISETSHLGVGRGEWIVEVARECRQAIDNGVDLHGICLYPILDRPDWDNLHLYHNSGLWDLEHQPDRPPKRVLCEHYAKDLLLAQQTLNCYTPLKDRWLYA
jgi:beta-glucosidase/6-phospho-beta-glucosidase/beta-galactosidase